MFKGATTENLPPGVLYRVKATYKYNREDADELSFDVGEIVRVVEYDDPEEQVQQIITYYCFLATKKTCAIFHHFSNFLAISIFYPRNYFHLSFFIINFFKGFWTSSIFIDILNFFLKLLKF